MDTNVLPLSFSDIVSAACTPPFGPLNALYEHIMKNAVGFTPQRVAIYLAPIAFMYAQAYLLLSPGTKYTRTALGIAAVTSMWSAWTGIRFTNPWYNGWNHCIAMPYVQFMVKAVEFGLLEGPIRDPYMPERSRAVAAWDLLINSRMVGLGNVGLDTVPGIPNAKVQRGTVERHLRYNVVGWRPKNRAVAIARHAAYSAFCYTVIDMMYQLLPRLHPVFRQPHGGAHVLPTFANSGLRLLPGVLDIPFPPFAVVMLVQAGMGLTIWMIFEGLFQLFAVIHLLLGWPVEAWDVNMFGSVWRADSLIDLWGTRWHQTFRHMFIVCSIVLLNALRVPITSANVFMATFFFSGVIHVVPQLTMDPVGSPAGIMIFFLAAGAGCALEVMFKRATGRKVHGVWGQIWTWTYMGVWGTLVAHAWLEAGFGGNVFTSPGGPGDYVAQFIAKYVVSTQ